MPHAPSAYTINELAMSLPSSGFAPNRRHRAASVATSRPFVHGSDRSTRSQETAIYDPEAVLPSIEATQSTPVVGGGNVAPHREPTRNFFHSSFRGPPGTLHWTLCNGHKENNWGDERCERWLMKQQHQ